MGKIKEWIKGDKSFLVIVVVFVIAPLCLEVLVFNEDENDIAIPSILCDKDSQNYDVVAECFPDAIIDTNTFGVTRYFEMYEDSANARVVFENIVRKVCQEYVGRQVEPQCKKENKRIFACRGEETSVIVAYVYVSDCWFGPPYYGVSIEYAQTERYDWDYLSWRMTHD